MLSLYFRVRAPNTIGGLSASVSNSDILRLASTDPILRTTRAPNPGEFHDDALILSA